jgi:two-component system chemotaxis response regulator CheB
MIKNMDAVRNVKTNKFDNFNEVVGEEMSDNSPSEILAKDVINLLIVDDSRVIRHVIKNIFENHDHIRIVGEARNGKEALKLIADLDPDVVTLDINMPVMDGLTALKHIMIKHPKPTVMLSTLTREGAVETFDALKYGAVDFIHKPSRLRDLDIGRQHESIIKKVTYAAKVEIGSVHFIRSGPESSKREKISPQRHKCESMFVIGASEGGYGPLLKIIPNLDPHLPAAFIVVLYAPPAIVGAFARYLDNCSGIPVKRAVNGHPVEGGVCYLISGNELATLYENDNRYFIKVAPSPFPDRRGAINMLMFSIANLFKAHAVGVILSGEGGDGVEGLNEILRQGGTALVQDPKSCLSKEMPAAAISKAGVNYLIPDTKMAAKINGLLLN